MIEKAIKSIVEVAGIPAFKCNLNTGRPGWGIEVVYTFEDGTTAKSWITTRCKRDLIQQVANDHAEAVAGNTRATFEPDPVTGEPKFFSTVHRYRIGA